MRVAVVLRPRTTSLGLAMRLRKSRPYPRMPLPLPPCRVRPPEHPQGALPDLAALETSRRSAVPEFSAGDVASAIRSFKHASGPGPTGLRPDHLREALGTAHAD